MSTETVNADTQVSPSRSKAGLGRARTCKPSKRDMQKAALERSALRFDRRRVGFRRAWIEHQLCASGRLRRFVVLDSARLREALGQPRRREIEPLHTRQEQFELRTSELWELAQQQAVSSLTLLFERVREARKTTTKQARPRIAASGVVGTPLLPVPGAGPAYGTLLYAGSREGVTFCVELLDENGVVRRVAGVDLARALEASGAEPGDVVRVVPHARHEVAIQEQRTGSHGEGRSTLRRHRETFEVIREGGISARAEPSRPTRSADFRMDIPLRSEGGRK